jgi:crotonobetaine/carnitine-CoA ligase
MTQRPNLATALEDRARRTPSRRFLTTPGQPPMTFGEFNARANRLAHGLRDAVAVHSGECVAIMSRNCNAFIEASYALKKLGAIEAAINTDFRGPGLAHMLSLTEARVLIVGADLLAAVEAIADDLPHLQAVLVHGIDAGSTPASGLGWTVRALRDTYADDEANPPSDWHNDIAAVLFTSGTTGPSKGCILSQRYALVNAQVHVDALELGEDDCLYNPFPLYHLDASYLCVLPAILAGCRAAVSARFSASRFWDEIREVGATVFDIMGATLTILAKHEPRPNDADNPVRLAWGVPMPDPETRRELEERFGLRLVHLYGLTDGGVPCWESIHDREPPGSCGKVRPHWELKIVDHDGDEVAPGEQGEIVIRPRTPGAIMDGYWGMPEQSLKAFRGLWLHTGDIGRKDEAGHVFFISRQTDAIRRRGQNISTWEVEQVINSHPAVAESAAYGVPSGLSEEEVKIAVVLRDGARLSEAELREYCAERMAKYMIPAYIDFREEIPKTATGKSQRFKLG